jgi:hypothetical protein
MPVIESAVADSRSQPDAVDIAIKIPTFDPATIFGIFSYLKMDAPRKIVSLYVVSVR